MNFQNAFLNKNILITGACSDIGLSIFKEFYELGGNVILSDHPDLNHKLIDLKNENHKKDGRQISIMPIDLTDTEKIDLKDIKVDVLVNCAGRNVFAPLVDVTEEIWDSIININLKGTFFMSQKVAKNMIKHKIKGRIINIGSQHGVVANGLRAPYCVSKFGIVGMTKVFALELSPFDILVNCVSPTFVKTKKSEEFLENENVKKSYLPKIPLGKFAEPFDIASIVIFLASDFNRMITGENILVDGGYTIH